MTTQDSPLVNAAMEEGAVPYMTTVMRWAFPDDVPYSYIEYPADIDLAWAQQNYAEAVDAYRRVRDAKIIDIPTGRPQSRPQQSPAGPQRPQQRQGARGSQYPPDGLVSTLNDATQWTCDKCHATGEGVARRPQKGGMQSDAIVCLNPQCKENNYRYTIAWDDGTTMGPVDNGQADISEGALPF